MQTYCIAIPNLYLLSICFAALAAGGASLCICYCIDRYIAYRNDPFRGRKT